MKAMPGCWTAQETTCARGVSRKRKVYGTTTASRYRREYSAGDLHDADDLRAGVSAIRLLDVRRIRHHPHRVAGHQDDARQRLARRPHVRLRQAAPVHLVRVCVDCVLRVTAAGHW